MIWLLLFAVYPGALDLAAPAGSTTTAELLVVGDEPIRLTASGPLAADERIALSGKHHLRVPVTVKASTPPGEHEAYLYISPDTAAPIAEATAVRVRTTVEEPGPTRIVTQSQETFTTTPWGLIGLLGAALLGLLLAAVRIER